MIPFPEFHHRPLNPIRDIIFVEFLSNLVLSSEYVEKIAPYETAVLGIFLRGTINKNSTVARGPCYHSLHLTMGFSDRYTNDCVEIATLL